MDQGPPLQYTYTIAQHSLFSCQRTKEFVTRAVHYTLCTEACQGTLLPNFGWVFPKTACPHRNTRTRLPRQEAQAPCEQVGRYQSSPRESSTIYIHDEIILKIHQSPLSIGLPGPIEIVRLSRPTLILARLNHPERLSRDTFVTRMTF